MAYCSATENNDKNQKQIIIAKIRHWLQHHNGIIWDDVNSTSGYKIQRSRDAINWSTIHSQRPLINNQQSSVNYYEDTAPLNGTNYYRLSTTNVSGVVTYSNVIAVAGNVSNLSIYPNPAKNSLRIKGLPSNQKTKLSVIDFTGNLKLQATSNNSIYNLNIVALKAGNYMLKVEMNNDMFTKTFVKE